MFELSNTLSHHFSCFFSQSSFSSKSACTPFVIIISILITHQHHHHHHFFFYHFCIEYVFLILFLLFFRCLPLCIYSHQERTEKTQIWYHFVYYANHANDFRNKSARFFSAFPIPIRRHSVDYCLNQGSIKEMRWFSLD